MRDEIIAGEYAKGLFISARNLNENEFVLGELKKILCVFKENKQLMLIFKNPSIAKKDKLIIIAEILNIIKCNELVHVFFKILIHKNRFESLEDIVISYTQLNDEFTGHENLLVESAVKLAHEEIEAIKKVFAIITKKKIKLNVVVNNSLVGGLKIAYKDNVIDATIKSHLEILKKDLMLS